MKKLYLLLVCAVVTLLFCQCSGEGGNSVSDVPAYNEYVSAYTSGSISRKSDVRVVFAQDIPLGKLDSIKPADVMKISPKVEGTFSFADPRTLVFVPSKEMNRNTLYAVTVETQKLFGEGSAFEFSFQTRPFAICGSLKTFGVTDDDQYQLTFSLTTADQEASELVEKHISLPQGVTPTWTHAADGVSHLMTVVTKSEGKATQFEVSTESDSKLGLVGQIITSVELPDSKTFQVVSQTCKSGETRCIEVTFNKNLDDKQDVTGLVYTTGHTVTQTVVEGNRVLLYGNWQDNEAVNVTIDKALKSRSGMKISQSQTKSVVINNNKPSVEFVGDGTIVPQGDKILLPFRSVYMKGVRVSVYKIFSNMVGSMLQQGDINEYGNFSYAARPIAFTTFFIDDDGADLSEWHTYAVDLTEQVKLEPGAMYRVELSLDARLSAWPCDTLPHATREEMAEADAALMEKTCTRFDKGSYYYTGRAYENNDWWYDENYYEKRSNPAASYYYNDHTVGKNVLATNIGLSALKGVGSSVSITAINIPDAQPMSGVSVEVYSLQRQLIGSGKTNGAGIAEIEFNQRLGQPSYVVARRGDDVSYLKVGNDQSLSTSTFDVSGSVVERGLKGFIYGDRGVWRPGDTLHIAFMLNDKDHTLPADHPVTLRLSNPLGQVTHRITRTSGIMGLYAYNIPIAEDAPTGIWSAQIGVGGVTFHKNLRIETIKPNRLKIDLKTPEVLTNGKNEAKLHTEWLNGNATSGLKYEVNATVIETKTSFSGYKDYVFDDPTCTFETSEVELAHGNVGTTGDASLSVNLSVGKSAPGMLKGNVVTHVYEPSGEFSVDVNQVYVSPFNRYVGIKAPKQSRRSHLDTDKDHNFSVVSVDPSGKPVPNVKVQVEVFKVYWHWWWSSSREDLAGYTSSSYHKPVKKLDLKTDMEGKTDFNLNIPQDSWGTYLILVHDVEGGHSTGAKSYFDWPWMTSRSSENDKENATSLSLSVDKQEYAPGDKMHISFPSDQGSTAIVSISNGSKVLHLETYPCQKERTEIVLEATEEMMPNVYVAVSLVQPYSQTVNDMPIRMYGIIPVAVTSDQSHLYPVVKCADELQPETRCTVSVSEKSGRPMGYTLAIVDEGLLDLTRFKTPEAWPVFNAREALGVRFWDLYNHVNGAYGGRIEQLFSIGGDDALNNTPKAIVNRFAPMVYFAGPFELKKGETRTHHISVPNYNGRVRVMVVAGDGRAYGSCDKSVLVRKPLMMIGTMPRQIGRGDEMTVSATLFATQKLGDVKVNISTAGGLSVVGDKSQSVSFAEAGDKTVHFRVKCDNKGTLGTVSLQAASSGCKADYTANITIRTVSQTLSQSVSGIIQAGQTSDQTLQFPGDDDYRLLLEVSSLKPLNLRTRLKQLIGYPHGCVEQTTSRAFPQLYLSEFAELSETQKAEVEANVKACISRLVNFQTDDGGMSYWPSSRDSHSWASAYVLQFLSEASARGYYVPEDMMRRLKAYVTGQVTSWTSKYDSYIAAYQMYVLSSLHMPEWGAMNRMKEQGSNLSTNAICFLSAAYSLSGRSDIGRELLNQESYGYVGYWWSPMVSQLLAYLAVDDDKLAAESAEKVRERLMSDMWMSTSDCAGSLMAMSRLYQKKSVGTGLRFEASLDGKKLDNVKTNKFSWVHEAQLPGKQAKLNIHNSGDGVIYLSTTTQGVATQSHVDKMVNGLDLSIRYTTDGGQPMDLSRLSQSTTFKAVLSIHNVTGKAQENVAVSYIVPAGWEILSTTPTGDIHYQDVRDDRVYSYINHLKQGESLTITYSLSATYSGRYYLPSAHAEVMYDATVMGCTESGECEVKGN